ncbi:MAG: hypothetical protein LBU32_22575 [Clostridiales bacterium]|jgi:hypothetical protein|nr:hypothetical protein [Clostridiales bacterium]
MTKKFIVYMNVSEVMDRTFDVFKKSFFQQIGICMCFSVISSSVAVAAVASGVLIGAVAYASSAGLFESWGLIAAVAAAALAVAFLFSVLSSLSYAASAVVSWQIFSGRIIDLRKAFARSFKAVLRIASVVAADFIISLPVAALIIGLIYFFGATSGLAGSQLIEGLAVDAEFLSRIFIWRNLFALLAAVIAVALLVMVAYNWFVLALYCALFDGKYFFGALMQSYRLMKGDFWKVLGMRAAFMGVTYVLSYSFLSVFYIGYGFISQAASSMSETTMIVASLSAVQFFFSAILSYVLAPLNSIFSAVVYFNQKIKHDGLDLEILLNRRESAMLGEASHLHSSGAI